jgi:pimeloyl-ACP methyl ester carboxylesterase
MEDLMQRRTLLASLAASALAGPDAQAAAEVVMTRDNQRLACIDRGAGKPVVFIHGWSLGSAIWSLQADWLAAQGLRVIAYDRQCLNGFLCQNMSILQ